MPDPAIRTEELEKSYGRRRALRGVSLEVRQGEIFGFLGPNGAGKTTAIRCFFDLIRPSGGTVRVLGIDPQLDPVAVRQRTGYLPGELRLDEGKTVRATLEYFASLRDANARATARRRYPELAERIQLELDVRVGALSKGNKQKVGLIQALMHEPALLVLDEPTSGLDPLMQHEVLTMVTEAKERGATVFFSSHHLTEVQGVAERVGMIRAGVLVEVADTERLLERSFRRVVLRVAEPLGDHGLADIEGVTVLGVDGDRVRLEVVGQMGKLLPFMTRLGVVDFETETPTLEEIFRSYYSEGAA